MSASLATDAASSTITPALLAAGSAAYLKSAPVTGGFTGATPAAKLARATAAAKDFEAFFVTSMLESMYAGVKPDPMFGGGDGESMYRSLLNQQYGHVVADRDSFGIADAVRAEMLRSQEKAKA